MDGVVRNITDRKRAEQALRESEAKLRSIVDTTAEWIWEMDLSGRHTYSNRRLEAILGYSADEFHKTNVFEIFHPEDREDVEERLPGLIASKSGWSNWTLRYRHKDGSYRYLESNVTPISDDAGELTGYRGSDRDVTARLTSERALRDSEEKFRQLAENLHQVFWLVDQTKPEVIYISPAYEKVWGRSCESLYQDPMSFVEAIHPDDRDRVADTVPRQVQGEETDETYRIIRPDGSVRWIRNRAFPIRETSGRVYRVAGIADDITEIKFAEDARRASEAQFRSLLENHVDAVELVVDGKIVYGNTQMSELTGHIQQEYLGRSPVEFLAPKDHQRAAERTAAIFAGEPPTASEYQLVRKDGSTLCVEILSHVIQHGDKPALMSVLRDVTERKRMEQVLRRADRLASTGTLAAGIAHEINNPISAAWTAAESALRLKDKPNADDLFEESLRAVVDSVKRCDQIIQSVLRFARNHSSDKSPHDINEVVRRGCEMARVYAERNNARLTLKLAGDLPQPTINAIEIEQILVNLLHNAIEAGEGTTEITVSTAVVGDTVSFSVQDQGRGLSEAEQTQIFDPFYTLRGDEGGVGLGLNIAYGIIQEYGSSIELESEVGVGTTMTVNISLASAIVASNTA